MVVVNSRAGQRSNRLITIAQAMGAAIEQGEMLRLTAFDGFKADYECAVTWGGRVVMRDSRMWEFVRLALAAVNRLCPRFVVRVPGILTIAASWHYQDKVAFRKHRDKIRGFFRPVERLRPKLERSANEIVVGVHVRRGDYKEFAGGRYYYEDEVYERNKAAIVRQLSGLGKSIRFIMFPLVSAVEDQWLMSQCDYLMGPPSTFSMWASFMGRVPLAQITDCNQTISLSDFKPMWE